MRRTSVFKEETINEYNKKMQKFDQELSEDMINPEELGFYIGYFK